MTDEVAFGIASGPEPDVFLVALAAYRLVCDAAEERPLVGLADDAHWLDRSTLRVLTFIARRLESESVALLVSVQTDAGMSGWDGASAAHRGLLRSGARVRPLRRGPGAR